MNEFRCFHFRHTIYRQYQLFHTYMLNTIESLIRIFKCALLKLRKKCFVCYVIMVT